MRREFPSVTHRIAIPMQARTQWTNSNVWLQLATTPEWSFTIGDRQNENEWWNREQRAIWNATCWIDARRRVIHHQADSDGSDGVRPLWQSHSARTKMCFADVLSGLLFFVISPISLEHLFITSVFYYCTIQLAFLNFPMTAIPPISPNLLQSI